MTERGASRRAGKSGRPKVVKTSEVGGQKSEEENNSKIQQRTANSKLQTETMEVHHHPEVEKKGFKEYILEGLMIFLAVTMGFFAETIRENISDNAKGNEYIRSFVQDLQRDTATFSRLLAFDEKKTAVLNNLTPCYSIIAESHSAACLVPIMKSSLSNKNVNFTDGTMQQLKNAGGFRLLKNGDKDSIVSYDYAVRSYQNFESTVFQERQDIIRDADVKLFNFKADAALLSDSLKNDVEIPLLFSENKALLNEYFNDLLLYKRVNNSQMRMIYSLKKQAINLIKYFDNKYDQE